MPRVRDLFVHPLKGAAAMRVQRLVLDAFGAVGDRRWVLASPQGVALTQRDVPQLAQLRAELPLHDGAVRENAPLTLSMHGVAPHVVQPASYETRIIRVWDDAVELTDAGDEAAAWVSAAVARACRLMHWTSASRRPLAARFSGPVSSSDRHVTVTDGAPLLLLGTASLDALNARLAAAESPTLGLERFRPNIVLDTRAAHDEDRWQRVRIGTVELGIGSPCARCVVTTIDQQTLARGAEPLRTLATYRRGQDGSVLFGMNATHAEPGEIAVGTDVTVLSAAPGYS